MSSIIPDSTEPNSGWNTKNHYFYEINVDGKQFYIQLVFSSKDFTDLQSKVCSAINEWSPKNNSKKFGLWKICFTTKKSNVDDDLSEDLIFENLNNKLKEIDDFEKKIDSIIMEKYGSIDKMHCELSISK